MSLPKSVEESSGTDSTGNHGLVEEALVNHWLGSAVQRSSDAPHLARRQLLCAAFAASVSGCADLEPRRRQPAQPEKSVAEPLPSFPAGGRQSKADAVQTLTWDDPFTASVVKYAYLSGVPSLDRFSQVLITDLEERNRHKDELRYEPEPSTSTRYRAIVSNARSIALTDHSYWELLFIDAALTVARTMTLAAASGLPEPAIVQQLPANDLEAALRSDVQVFEFSVIVSGRFKAGGRPADRKGYADDMEANGFGDELSVFAARLVELAKPHLSERQIERYDMRSGKKDETMRMKP